jgi:hypothetical protein
MLCLHSMRWLGNYLSNLGLRLLGPASMIWFILATVIGGLLGLFGWHRARLKEGKSGVQNWHLLLTGIAGTWIFLSLAMGAAAWSIYQNQGLIAVPQKDADSGPLQWYSNIEMEGGPPRGLPVFALTFFGGNISQKEVLLKGASIVSAKNGRKIDLDVVARDDTGTNVPVPINQINLIPPGAPVRLLAKFGDPDPNAPGKILGLDAKTFLETWSQFYVIIEDDTKTYRLPFNEGNLMSFFPGMVGPHITKK